VAQLTLPLRSGGFRRRVTTTLESDLPRRCRHRRDCPSVRTCPHSAFPPRKPHLRLPHTPMGNATQRYTAPGLWSGPARELEGTCLASILSDAQRLCGRHLAQQRFASLLASTPATLEGSRLKGPPSLLRAQASLNLVGHAAYQRPTSWPLTLSDSEWASSTRLPAARLPAGPANAPPFRCACGFAVLPDDPDHFLTCPYLAQQRTSRHDLISITSRRRHNNMSAPYYCPGRRAHNGRASRPFLRRPPPSAGLASGSSSRGSVPAPLSHVLVPRRPLISITCIFFG
jgi:hypothetical protein